jgi:hypothetical protein
MKMSKNGIIGMFNQPKAWLNAGLLHERKGVYSEQEKDIESGGVSL